MFNPLDLLKSTTEEHENGYKAHDKAGDTYLKEVTTINYKGDNSLNSAADYFRKKNLEMFVENVKMFTKK